MWIIFGTAAYLMALLSCIAAYAVYYMTEIVQVASFSQFLYTMQVSMGGAENTIMQILEGFFEKFGFWVLLLTILYFGFLFIIHKHKNDQSNMFRAPVPHPVKSGVVVCCLLSFALLASQLHMGYEVLGVRAYLDQKSQYSTLYENYYVQPSDVSIVFPSKKKNLIFIYCESMESSFASRKDGGLLEENVIDNLTKLALENTDFSNTNQINGGYVTNNTSWTIAGIVAQTSGTPLGLDNDEYTRYFEDDSTFMPNLTTLGDILEENGYINYFMCGSKAAYAGRANYFQQHGNYQIYDLQTARDTGKVPEDYKVWWGLEDEKLFEYSKEQITKLAQGEQPFNFTMLTVDTHFSDGYKCPDCPDEFDEQMLNVLACSDQKVYEFVKWIEQQDFYEDTTIIISGDHLSMDGLFTDIVKDGEQRKTYFTVINGPEYTLDQRREYTTLDIFPTTLAAMGVQIEGDRLGLGTSLYANEPTLCEKLGFNYFNDQIAYQSAYYNNVIAAGDESKRDPETEE